MATATPFDGRLSDLLADRATQGLPMGEVEELRNVLTLVGE